VTADEVDLQHQLADFERRGREFIERSAPLLEWPSVAVMTRPPITLLNAGHHRDEYIPVARQWQAMKFDAGFGWLSGPTLYGGAGLPPTFEERYFEIEQEYSLPKTDFFWFGMESVVPAVLEHASEDLKQQVIPRIFRGDLLVCQLYSEPNAGSDLASLSTRAVKDGDSWVVNGQKVWSSGAYRADIGLLLVRTGTAEERHRGITAFLVDIRTPGIDVRPLREMDGSTGFSEVFFNDVVISDGRRVGEVGTGWAVAMGVQANARSGLGMSRRRGLADIASTKRLGEMMRRRGVGDDPLLRQARAHLYASSQLLGLTTERLIREAPNSSSQAAARAISKVVLSDILSQSANLIRSILGPRLVADLGAEDSAEWVPYVLQVLGFHIGGGTDEVLLNVIAERGLGLPR